MYPTTYFSLFPPAPRRAEVFVAMSFDAAFRPRWDNVIEPAISGLKWNGAQLQARRVDMRLVSDSVLTEILDGIANAVVVLGDVTTISHAAGKPVRNANVMYEIGIAHATRQASEVVLFRSDNDKLLFDISNVRVNAYDPDNDPAAARDLVSKAVQEAITETDLSRSLVVRKLMESLDLQSIMALAMIRSNRTGLEYEALIEAKDTNKEEKLARMLAVQRLLDTGLIENVFTDPKKFTQDQFRQLPVHLVAGMKVTRLGNAVADAILEKFGWPIRPPAS